MNKTAVRSITGASRAIVMVLLLSVTLFPLFWIVSTAFRPDSETLVNPPMFLPHTVTTEQFVNLFADDDTWKFIKNSLIATVASTVLVLAVAAPASYALARHRFPADAGRAIIMFMLAFRFIPGFVFVIPLFLSFRDLHLLDNVWALVLMYTVMNLPLSVWIMMPTIQSIPMEINEAAAIDGASVWQTFTRVVLPLMGPALATAGTLSMIFAWNEFFVALIFTQNNAVTLPVLMSTYIGDFGIQWGRIAATALVAVAPIVLLGLLAQRALVRGMTAGAVK